MRKIKVLSQRLIWQCNQCDDIIVSHSHRRHEMNFCKCGKTGVDLEEGLIRVSCDDNIIILSNKMYHKKSQRWYEVKKNIHYVYPWDEE